MKPSLQYPRRISRLLSQMAKRNHLEIQRNGHQLYIRSFASARPLPSEELHRKPATGTGPAANAVVSDSSSAAEEDYVKEYISPAELTYTGNVTMPITSVCRIVTPQEDVPRGTWPVFRLMDENGKFRDPAFDAVRQKLQGAPLKSTTGAPKVTTSVEAKEHDLAALQKELKEQYPFHEKEIESSRLFHPAKHAYPDTQSTNTLMRAHRQMLRLRQMDDILQNAQRQGRISFYMTCRGEEAIHFGSASALELQDTVFAQYREAGLLMWRGFTLEQFANQCFSNDLDLGKGRQMPVHYGSRALHYQTISSPLGTQIPQAVGAAYHDKLIGKKNVSVCFFGDGAASTTDFHSGMNFAATLNAPVIFFCRNNGYAISTPIHEQYKGDGIVSRAPGYGMAAIRVDGNDVFAVHAAVREARAYALKHSAPVLIEAMTYRLGHHSTSDDSTRYRDRNEVEEFEDRSDPLKRVEHFLKDQKWISDKDVSDAKDEEKMAVLKAMSSAEKRPYPPLDELFTDVYHEIPPRLQEQKSQLLEHLKKYKSKYDGARSK